jgi:transcription initiation factor IIF auxiliary subunit
LLYFNAELRPPFILEEEAWGSFEIGLSFHFKDDIHLPIHASYDLKLEKKEDDVVRALVRPILDRFPLLPRNFI